MGNFFKSFSKDTLFYGLSGAFSKTIGFLLLPFLTNKISPEEFGTFALLSMISIAILPLSNLGTSPSLTIFYFEEQNNVLKQKLIWTNFLQLLFFNVLIISLIIFFSKDISLFILGSSKNHELLVLFILGLCFNTLVILSEFSKNGEKSKVISNG